MVAYTPGCSKCKAVKAEVAKLADGLAHEADQLSVIAFDSSSPAASYFVSTVLAMPGVPAFCVFPAHSRTYYKYKGARVSTESLLKFLNLTCNQRDKSIWALAPAPEVCPAPALAPAEALPQARDAATATAATATATTVTDTAAGAAPAPPEAAEAQQQPAVVPEALAAAAAPAAAAAAARRGRWGWGAKESRARAPAPAAAAPAAASAAAPPDAPPADASQQPCVAAAGLGGGGGGEPSGGAPGGNPEPEMTTTTTTAAAVTAAVSSGAPLALGAVAAAAAAVFAFNTWQRRVARGDAGYVSDDTDVEGGVRGAGPPQGRARALVGAGVNGSNGAAGRSAPLRATGSSSGDDDGVALNMHELLRELDDALARMGGVMLRLVRARVGLVIAPPPTPAAVTAGAVAAVAAGAGAELRLPPVTDVEARTVMNVGGGAPSGAPAPDPVAELSALLQGLGDGAPGGGGGVTVSADHVLALLEQEGNDVGRAIERLMREQDDAASAGGAGSKEK
ncbi:hypothetical protein FOA52_013902 [Chlamydomonas sp. UWO 241]|nr:hypothetical protein FOA52_013902 [Chlamydomonas sp. UWO 241]